MCPAGGDPTMSEWNQVVGNTEGWKFKLQKHEREKQPYTIHQFPWEFTEDIVRDLQAPNPKRREEGEGG